MTILKEIEKNRKEAEKYKIIIEKIRTAKENYQKKRNAGEHFRCVEEIGFLNYVGDSEYKKIYQEYIDVLKEGFFVGLINDHDILSELYLHTLTSIDAPDLGFYKGIICEKKGLIDDAINNYGTVSEESQHYYRANENKANLITQFKDYITLASFLDEKTDVFSSLDDILFRVRCLVRTSKSETISKDIINYPFRKVVVESKDVDYQKVFYVCSSVASLVLIAGSLMHECLKYCNDFKVNFDTENSSDIQKYIDAYNKMVFILKQCDCITFIKTSNSKPLADLTLYRFSWVEKLKIIQDPNYTKQIINTIISLVSPKSHPNIDEKVPAITLLDHLVRINKRVSINFLDSYFDCISNAIKENNKDAIRNVSSIYAWATINNNNDYNIAERIRKLLKECNIETKEEIEKEELRNWLSNTGWKLYNSAEEFYSFAINSKIIALDASSISTAFFRIFEIEFNDKIIEPLIRRLNYDSLKTEFRNEKARKYDNTEKDSYQNKWGLLLSKIKKIQDPSDKLTTLELGNIRYLFENIRTSFDSSNNVTDPVGDKLYEIMKGFLSEEGKVALFNGQLEAIISEDRINKYRNPLSHTEITPLSTAKESRTIVINDVPKLIKWIKKEDH